MANLLVTGAAGFIGANFVYYWLENNPGDTVIALDALTYAGNRASLADAEGKTGYRFVHGDIRDQALIEQLLQDDEIDTIVHFAAESHVDRSITGPDEFIDTNIIGTYTMLKAAKAIWLDGPKGRVAHRFHHVSTDEVYGSLEKDDPAFTEDTAYAPNSPYSASKAASDHLVRAYHHTYGMDVTTSNCSNNYGPYQFPEKLIPLILINILHGKSLPIYGDGLNIRDWLYVDDHARGIDLIIKQGRVGETYNIGGHNEWTNIDIVNLVCELMDERYAEDTNMREAWADSPAAKGKKSNSLITYVKDRLGHDHRYAIDATKTTAELSYKPVESFESGIRKTVQWYLDNEAWWQSIMDGSYKDWIDLNYKDRKAG